jgi:antitoxin HicB
VAEAHGVNIRKPGGSHVVFEHPGVPEAVWVPARRPIKPFMSVALSCLSNRYERAMSDSEYRFTARLLSGDEGGGYLIEFPDLPGWMSDGETIEEAITNGEDAKRCWIAAMNEAGRTDPAALGRTGRRLQRQMAAARAEIATRRLAERAKREGVSLNTLAVTLLAEALGERAAHER